MSSARKSRRWTSWVVSVAVQLVLVGLAHLEQFRDGPLSHWPVRVVLGVAVALGCDTLVGFYRSSVDPRRPQPAGVAGNDPTPR